MSANDHPAPRQTYKGTLTNTDRWQSYTVRAGDVFVCTPPKCGTTWSTAIVSMLLQGQTDVDQQNLVHWVDAKVVPVDEMAAAVAGQSGRRCLKTHTNFDGIPWSPDAYYIAVYRHPIDRLFSLRKHLSNAKNTDPEHPYLGSADEALRAFVQRPYDPNDFDGAGLDGFVRHYQSYAAQPRQDNLLVLHYADMLADPQALTENIAKHIGGSYSDRLKTDVTQATSFGQMKAKADRYAPFSAQGYWHDPSAFFDSARTGGWRDEVSEAVLHLYNDMMRQLLPEGDIAWLQGGNAG